VRLETLRSNHVPSCWPPRFAVAPFTDCSMLDPWLSPLRTDCSALCSFCPVPTTDLTRCSTLTPCASRSLRSVRRLAFVLFADHPAPRISPWSALRTLPRYDLRHTRDLAFRDTHRLLQVRRFLLCDIHGSLRARRLTRRAGLRIAPYADTLRPREGYGLLHAFT